MFNHETRQASEARIKKLHRLNKVRSSKTLRSQISRGFANYSLVIYLWRIKTLIFQKVRIPSYSFLYHINDFMKKIFLAFYVVHNSPLDFYL